MGASIEIKELESRLPGYAVKALAFAKKAHGGQVRKYNAMPYVIHPIRVAVRLHELGCDETSVIAGLLHDVIEDTAFGRADLEKAFGRPITDLVLELTNPSKHWPHLTRASRKALDHKHLSGVSDIAKVIKLVDRIDNINDMGGAGAGFKAIYLSESRLLLDAIGQSASPELYDELKTLIELMKKDS